MHSRSSVTQSSSAANAANEKVKLPFFWKFALQGKARDTVGLQRIVALGWGPFLPRTPVLLLFGHCNVSAYVKHFSLGHFSCRQTLSLEKHAQHRFSLSEGERKRRLSPVALHLHRMKNYVRRGHTLQVSRLYRNRRLGSCTPQRPEIVLPVGVRPTSS
jgi:hypothetical protein